MYTFDPVTLGVSSKTDADGHVTRYAYDPEGNRTNLTDALGNVTSYTYEPLYNQMTSLTDPNGRITIFKYDSRGNLTNQIDLSARCSPGVMMRKGRGFVYGQTGLHDEPTSTILTATAQT